MAIASYKKFDVKHGISVNGLPFVDENRNVTVNDLTVQGVSTIIDTRTVTSVDPIISLGTSGRTYTAESITTGTPGRIKFAAAEFDDFAIGDSVEFNLGAGATLPTGLTDGTVYYVVGKDTDVTSSDYRTVTIATTQGGAPIAISGAGSGDLEFTLNPLRDLDQDLGIEFNYVDGTAKKGFFGYKDTTGHFTFLLDTTYGGSSTQSDDGSSTPAFTGKKSGIEVKYSKLQPTDALTTNTPALDIDQTWNAGGVTFAAFDLDIVDTASDANSSLLDLAVGGNQKLRLRKDGALSINTSSHDAVLTLNQGTIAEDTLIEGVATWNASGTTFHGIDLQITDTNYAAGSKLINIDALIGGVNFNVDITGEIDTTQVWNAAGTTFTGIDLQVTPTAFASDSKLVNFFASADRNFSVDAYGKVVNDVEFTGGSLQTAIQLDVTDTSSAADSLLLDLQVGGATKFSVDKDGDVTLTGSINVDGPANFEDTITVQTRPNGGGTYEDNTQLQTSYVTLAAGASSATTINTFDGSVFVTGKYLVQIKQGSNYHSAEVLLLHDGSGAFMTEYAAIWNTSILGTLDAAVSGGDVILTLTPTAAAVAANTEIQVRITRITLAD
jgi:hypothetical protein